MAKAGLLFAGTSDGLALYSEPGAMGRWLRVDMALRGQSITGVWAVPTNPLVVIAGGAQLWRSDDGGQQWQTLDDQPIVALAGAGPCIIAASASGALLASSDAAATWQRTTAPWGATIPLLYGATRGTRLLAIANNTIWHTPTGIDWQPLPNAPGDVTLLAATDTEVVVLVEGVVYRQQGDWQLQGSAPTATTALALLAGAPPMLLAAHPGGISTSSDFGRTWQSATGAPTDVSLLAPTPYHVDTLFAGTTTGHVSISTDRGQTWRALRGESAMVTAIASGRLI